MQNTRSVAEQRVLLDLKENPATAFNDFYDCYAPALYGTIKKSLVNEDVANKTLIVTFQTLLSDLSNFDSSKESLFTWAAKIARKEINKQKIELILKQLFPCNDSDLVTEENFHKQDGQHK